MPVFRKRVRKAQTIEGQDAEHEPRGQVARRVVRLLGRERQLLDGEVEPDRERQG